MKTFVQKEALERYKKDLQIYQDEIEDIKEQLKKETDVYQIKHLNRCMLESQRALANVLEAISKIEEI